MSRAAFYRWRRQGAGPAVVRLPGGGVRVRRSALTAWLRRLEEQDTQEGQEQGADGQLRRQVLGHQEARQRHRGAVPGPVGGRRPRALQVVQGPPAGRRVPHRPEGRGPRPAALQPPHRPARSRDHRRGDDHLVRARPRLRRGQVAEPGPGLPPVGRRGPGHRHHRPHREGAGRARAEGAAAGAVRLGVQPRHPRHQPAAPDRRRPRLGRTRLAARSPTWKTPRPCGWRWPPAPRPWPGSRRPGRPSGASGRCSTTRSATPSNSGHLGSNPVDRIQWTAPAVAQSVDRRVVVSPAQARTPPGRRPGGWGSGEST